MLSKASFILAPRKRVGFLPKVRLEAGTLHLANYLIRVRGLFLVAKVTLIIESARALYKKTKPDSLNFFKGYRESTLQIYDS
jgi:hypothetical protein